MRATLTLRTYVPGKVPVSATSGPYSQDLKNQKYDGCDPDDVGRQN